MAVAFNGGEYRTYRGLHDALVRTYPSAYAWAVNLDDDDGYIRATVEYHDAPPKCFRSSHLIENGCAKLIRHE